MPLPPECWGYRCRPASASHFKMTAGFSLCPAEEIYGKGPCCGDVGHADCEEGGRSWECLQPRRLESQRPCPLSFPMPHARQRLRLSRSCAYPRFILAVTHSGPSSPHLSVVPSTSPVCFSTDSLKGKNESLSSPISFSSSS